MENRNKINPIPVLDFKDFSFGFEDCAGTPYYINYGDDLAYIKTERIRLF